MLSNIIKWSITRRWLVVFIAIAISIGIFRTVSQMPVDVFPAFAPPQVEIQTEAPGLAPEEVESLVTLPLESAINGTPGITTVRSSSSVGLSLVRATFSWDTNIYQARQLVTERLQQAAVKLPTGVETPQISPLNSSLGTVMHYAFTAETTSLMELRNLVDGQITNRLLAVPGVSQVVVYGGEERQYQILIDPEKLKTFGVSLQEVTEAAKEANINAPGGLLIDPDRETLIRGIGRIQSIPDIKRSVVSIRQGKPIRLEDVAEVKIGAAVKRGDASLNGKNAVVMVITKQAFADTPTVTAAIEAAMTEIKAGLPKDIKVTATFRQKTYIDASIDNVRTALIEGSIIVAVILIPFLMNWRALVVSLTALPLSLLVGLMGLNWLGQGLNAMTLGGLAVAIGSAVDDAIVDAENVYRCLRENKQAKILDNREEDLNNTLSSKIKNTLEIVFIGCQEVRDSLFGATLITVVIFSPIFALSGVEGRIFIPMGIAYLACVLASGIIALTLTPALCAILLPNGKIPEKEPWLARFCKQLYRPLLMLALRRSQIIIGVAVASLIATLTIVPTFGRVFLPEFQERSLVNSLILYPGVSLEATNRAGIALQEALKDDARFDYVQLRSGRVPGDEDAAGVNLGHLEIELSDRGIGDRTGSLQKLRQEFAKLPGVAPNIGGFISHRLDEVLSGVRSAIAVKIFGNDLETLRTIGKQVEGIIKTVDGVVDLQLEPQVPIQQLQIRFDREAASRYGLKMGQLAEIVETALNGRVVSQILEQQKTFDLLVWLKEDARRDLNVISNLPIDTGTNQKVTLSQLAQIKYATGPNTINRENVSRLIVVSANVIGHDLRSIVDDIRSKINQQVQFPAGYFIQYGGQFESEERATKNMLLFGAIACVAIAILMYWSLKSLASTIAILINLPLALVGGVICVALTGGTISVASLVGFITLFGVATRNGLLLVDNYNTKFISGMPINEVLVKGAMERLNAILMTALTSALGLAPLVIGIGPGKEILQPLAAVVLGGLFTSTALTLLVIPALYVQFGKVLMPTVNSNS